MFNNMNLIMNSQNVRLTMLFKILCFIFIGFNVALCFIKTKKYNFYVAKIEKNKDYNMKVYVSADVENFINSNEIIIDNKKYDYEIIDVENEYLIDNNDRFMVVNINANVNLDDLQSKNYISIKQDISNNSMYSMILEKIKKGMNL